MNTDRIEPVAAPHARSQRIDPAAARWSKRFVIVAVVGMLLFTALNVYLNKRQPDLPDELAGVTTFNDLSSEVVDGPVTYAQTPPAGGPHAELAQLCGLYRVPMANENIVASLATGAVWIAYQPGTSNSDVEALQSAAQGELDVIISPYPGLDAPVVLTSWGRQIRIDDPHDRRIAEFVHIYQNRDWAPNVDATCSVGVGLPLP